MGRSLPFKHKDHLHMRGEYASRWTTLPKALGSPPHAWRIHSCFAYAFHLCRITSTCVENTHRLPYSHVLQRDHLHMRGEYVHIPYDKNQYLGSPPHAWRIRYYLANLCTGLRITSTCVENTRPADQSKT